MKRNAYFLALTVVLAFVVVFGGHETDPGPSLPAAPSGLASLIKTETTIAVTWNGINGAIKLVFCEKI